MDSPNRKMNVGEIKDRYATLRLSLPLDEHDQNEELRQLGYTLMDRIGLFRFHQFCDEICEIWLLNRATRLDSEIAECRPP
jgi:hypothetical protein